MPGAADFKLTDLLSVAGATIGIIIAGAILLGNLNAKYIHLFERYRGLTGEYRGNDRTDQRKGSLHDQIACYRFRVRLVNFSSVGLSGALLLFLIAVAVASLSVAYPQAAWLRTAGAVTLFLGLAFIAVSLVVDAVETVMSRRAVHLELSDFPQLSRSDGVLSSR